MKARSRLVHQRSPLSSRPRFNELKLSSNLFSYHRQDLVLLLLSVPFFGAVFLITTRFYPSQIEDFLISNTFLPLQIPLFIANSLLFSFLFLNTRRGILISIIISSLLFLRLQQVVFDSSWFLPLLIFFAILELGFSKMSRQYANIEKNSHRNSTRDTL